MQPSTIAVRCPNWVGDQILAFPFFTHLRRLHPSAKITAICVPWVKDLQFHDLVDEVCVLKVDSSKTTLTDKFTQLLDNARALRETHPGGWDLGITLPNSFSAAFLLKRAGARRLRGFKTDFRSFLIDEKIPWDRNPQIHRSQSYLRLLDDSITTTEFWTDRQPFDYQKSWRSEFQAPPTEPYFVVAPGANAESRQWPIERFCQAIENLASKYHWKAVIVGGKKEESLVEYLKERLGSSPQGIIIDRVNQGSIASLAPIFRGAKFTLGNESGLAHVASLCGSPVWIVCGAADPRRTKPLGPGKVEVFTNPVDCWPCEKNTCMQTGEAHLSCLKGLDPDVISKSMEEDFELGYNQNK